MFSVAINQIVKVARIRIDHGHLSLSGFNYARVTMAHVGHIVVSIEILSIFLVIEVLHRAAYDLDRIVVGDTQISTEQPFPRGQGLGLCGCASRDDFVRTQITLNCRRLLFAGTSGVSPAGESEALVGFANTGFAIRVVALQCATRAGALTAGGTPAVPVKRLS